MAELKVVVEKLSQFFPLHRAGVWDNVGLLIEPLNAARVQRVMLCNDLTLAVASEAAARRCQLVLSYHPPLFTKFNRLVGSSGDPKQQLAVYCLANGLAVFSPHTASDEMAGGVNDYLAECCTGGDMTDSVLTAIVPRADDDDAGTAGLGRRLRLPGAGVPLATLVERLKAGLGLSHLLVAPGRDAPPSIGSVALCAGSGHSVLRDQLDVDCWLTGELSHHEALEAAERKITVICCLHSNSERAYLANRLKQQLGQVLPADVEVLVSQKDRDPFHVV